MAHTDQQHDAGTPPVESSSPDRGDGRRAERGQVSASAADVYEEFFVPALFGQWAPVVCDAAVVGAGERVADVATGTGVLARYAASLVGAAGHVVGVDVNEDMLAVARSVRPDLDWRLGPAEGLPLDDDSVDVVLSQFGMMFFDDRVAAATEMARVVRPGGRVGVAVWDDVATSPGYAEMISLLTDLFGSTVADALRAPFRLGDPDELASILHRGGLGDVAVRRADGTARFASIDAWVHVDVRGWTLADLIDDDQYRRLRTAARDRLSRFVGRDGSVSFAAPALVATAVVR